MYEFTDKKTREKFKKTAYGEKIGKSFGTAVGICAMFLLLLMAVTLLHEQGILNDDLLALVKFPAFISAIFAIYFDGKRDGAIEQFKKIK